MFRCERFSEVDERFDSTAFDPDKRIKTEEELEEERNRRKEFNKQFKSKVKPVYDPDRRVMVYKSEDCDINNDCYDELEKAIDMYKTTLLMK